MELLKTIKNNIPNTITCLNLLSGVVSITLAFAGNPVAASLCIGASAVFDFFDGFAARLLHAYSDIGKELDSLADLVSFGVAPAMILFCAMQAQCAPGSLLPYGALIIPAFGALRLAKFNIDTRQTTSFIGLPIPANAIFWIGYCAWMERYNYLPEYITLTIVVLISYLMVSNIRMFSLKFKSYEFGENVVRYAIILAAILFVVFYGLSGLMWTIIFYIILSLFTRSMND